MNGIGTITLTYLRKDLDREYTLNYWKTKHGWLVSLNSGCTVYRQVKFTDNPLLQIENWTVNQKFSNFKMPDGVAENLVATYINGVRLLLSDNKKKIYQDEHKFISDCFMYQTMKKNAIYHREELSSYNDETGLLEGERLLILFKGKNLKNIVLKVLPDICKKNDKIKEIHSYYFTKYNENLWRSIDVNHKQPKEDEYNAALMLGAEHKNDIIKLLNSEEFSSVINSLNSITINTFDVEQVLIMRYNNMRSLAAINGKQGTTCCV